jgi:hypothetical protein
MRRELGKKFMGGLESSWKAFQPFSSFHFFYPLPNSFIFTRSLLTAARAGILLLSTFLLSTESPNSLSREKGVEGGISREVEKVSLLTSNPTPLIDTRTFSSFHYNFPLFERREFLWS